MALTGADRDGAETAPYFVGGRIVATARVSSLTSKIETEAETAVALAVAAAEYRFHRTAE